MQRALRITAWIALAVGLVSFALLATPVALAFGLWLKPGILDDYDPNAINPIPQLLLFAAVTLPALAASGLSALGAFLIGRHNKRQVVT